MGAAAAIAIMRLKEREVVDEFRAAGAITPSTAQSYAAMGFGETRALKRLHDSAVIREASPGLYYPPSRCGIPQVVKPAVDIQPRESIFRTGNASGAALVAALSGKRCPTS